MQFKLVWVRPCFIATGLRSVCQHLKLNTKLILDTTMNDKKTKQNHFRQTKTRPCELKMVQLEQIINAYCNDVNLLHKCTDTRGKRRGQEENNKSFLAIYHEHLYSLNTDCLGQINRLHEQSCGQICANKAKAGIHFAER